MCTIAIECIGIGEGACSPPAKKRGVHFDPSSVLQFWDSGYVDVTRGVF